MKKSENSSTAPQDRLSELPNELIFQIFWWLPMSVVVRTTILSKRWKNLWTTADCLNFRDCMMDTADKVRTFIYRALTLWRGSRILKFGIKFDYHLVKSLYSDIDIWLRFATENQVEQLYVRLKYPGDGDGALKGTLEEMYWPPQCLYSCSSLKRLSLVGCKLIEVHEVHWKRLNLLCIDGGITVDAINHVLSGCPHLETLKLYVLENQENLSIKSSSLMRLYIVKFLYSDNEDVPSMNTELIISTPELEVLEIVGVPYSKYSLMNAPGLSELTLGFNGPNWYSHDLFHGNHFLEKTLMQILPTIQHVEKLTLSDWCIKALGAMKKKSMLPPLVNVKLLELNNDSFEEYEHIVCVLEIFPKLEILVLQPEDANNASNRIVANNGKSCPRLEGSLPESFLLQLRIVKVTWTNGDDSIFPFIEIVLKFASMLKKMVFRAEGTVEPNSLLLATKKLLGMPRSSPTAKLIFSEF